MNAPQSDGGASWQSRPTNWFQYNVEVVGTCNLRCPSCPVGNTGFGGRPKGLMDPAQFREIVQKIVRESPGRVTTVGFYDWGEPSLHPDLPVFIEILRENGLRSRVSSNLNVEKRLEPIVKANPDEFHISLSGFYQENYSQTHATGEVEQVKENIRNLARWKSTYGAKTRFVIGFHVYRHNATRDLPAMQALAQEVGFEIDPVVALFFPVEKRLAYLESLAGEPATTPGIEVTESDRKLLDLLLVRPEETERWFQRLPGLVKRRAQRDCGRRSKKLSIGVDGSVALCCVTYDPRFSVADSFLDTPHEEIQARRYANDFCRVCMEKGLHVNPGGIRQRVADTVTRGGALGRAALAALGR